MKCINCDNDMSEFAKQEFAFEDVTCPKCREEMTVQYDEIESDWGTEILYWLTKKEK